MGEPVVMQRENERGRVTLGGRRTDDGDRCTMVVICETGGTWAIYPHGATQLGVRIPQSTAEKLAQTILSGGAR